MATLQKKGNGWYCQFLHHGKRHTVTIGRVSKTEARAKSDQIEYLLMRLKQGLIELPAGVDIREFVQRDGKSGPRPGSTARATPLTLGEFRDGTSPPTAIRRSAGLSKASNRISSTWPRLSASASPYAS
jgi:hypothetical protein